MMTRICGGIALICFWVFTYVEGMGNSLWPPENTKNGAHVDPSKTLQGNKTCVSFCKHFSGVCKNKGICKQATDSKCHWYCECVPGYTGILCDQTVKNDTFGTENITSDKQLITRDKNMVIRKNMQVIRTIKRQYPNPRNRPGKRDVLGASNSKRVNRNIPVRPERLTNIEQFERRNTHSVTATHAEETTFNKRTIVKGQTRLSASLNQMNQKNDVKKTSAMSFTALNDAIHEKKSMDKISGNIFGTLMALRVLGTLLYMKSNDGVPTISPTTLANETDISTIKNDYSENVQNPKLYSSNEKTSSKTARANETVLNEQTIETQKGYTPESALPVANVSSTYIATRMVSPAIGINPTTIEATEKNTQTISIAMGQNTETTQTSIVPGTGLHQLGRRQRRVS